MGKATLLISNFSSGELSPRLRGRIDAQRYYNGCETLENMILMTQGGITSRPGTQYIATAKQSANAVRLVPFIFSMQDTYVLEFGNQYIRFYKNGAQLQKGGSAYEIATPYVQDDLFELSFVQSADVLYICHENYKPRTLSRFGDTMWSLTLHDLLDGPYLDINTTDITITPTKYGILTTNKAIASSGTRIIIAGSNGAINYTDDGAVYYEGSAKGLGSANSLRYENSYYLLAGNNRTIRYSATGTAWSTWTTTGLPTTYNCYDLAYVPLGGLAYLLVGSQGKIHTASAINGSWTLRYTASGDKNLNAIAYNPTGQYAVVVGAGGKIFKSGTNDLTTWTQQTSGTTKDLNDIAYNSTLGFIAVGNDGTIVTSSNGTTWTVQSPGVTVDLNAIDISSSGEIMVCGEHGIVLTATAINIWEISHYKLNLDLYTCKIISLSGTPKYIASGKNGLIVESDTFTGGYDIRSTPTILLTASDDVFIEDKCVGMAIRIKQKKSGKDWWGWGNVIKWVDPTRVYIDERDVVKKEAATTEWRLGAFYGADGENGNYPCCCGFYEQRLGYAGTKTHPQNIFFSQSGDYNNMGPTDVNGNVFDNHAIVQTLVSSDYNALLWLCSMHALIAGSQRGPWRIMGTEANSILAPGRVTARIQASYGSERISPKIVGNMILYVQKYGKKVRELAYSYDTDLFKSIDLTIGAQHITGSTGIKEMAFAQEPDSILWCVLNDGTIAAMTYDRDYDIIGWHRHTISGALAESVAVIPGSTEDEVWFSIAITKPITGTERHIVRMYRPSYETNIANSFFVDDGIVYSGSSTSTITGLSHLNGLSVAVLANGVVQTTKTVTGGAITLDSPATKVTVGLPYTQTVKTMDIEGAAQQGAAQGKPRRIGAIVGRWISTGYAKLGIGATKVDAVREIVSGTLYSGDTILNFPAGYERNYYVYATNDKPLPMTLLAVYAELITMER